MLRFLHCLIILSTLLLLSCSRATLTRVSLVDSFPLAEEGPILAPSTPLGEAEAASFLLGRAWKSTVEGKKTRVLTPSAAALRFYLDRPLDLIVTLRGRSLGEALSCSVSINEMPTETITLEPKWGDFQFEVPALAVRQGENRIVLEAPEDTEWSNLMVTARHSPEGVESRVFEDSLEIGYAHSVSYPVKLEESAALLVESLTPWQKAGVAQVSTGKLRVRLQADPSGFDEEWELVGSGPHRLELPAVGIGRLSLFAPLEAPLLPGQLGVRLSKPELELTETTVVPVPTPTPSAPKRNSPNVVIYMVDTLRADHLSVYGYDLPTSPRLEEFSQESVLFEDVTAEAPWTKPSTSTVLTGLPSLSHRAIGFADKLPSEVTTLAELFSEAGYATGGFFTNAAASPIVGLGQGFEVTQLEHGLSAEKVNSLAFDWLDGLDPASPFFLYVHTMDPHAPYTPAAEFARTWCPQLPEGFLDADIRTLSEHTVSQRPELGNLALPPPGLEQLVQCYDAEIAANDAAFGDLLDHLRKKGSYENTLIIFISDHGEELFDHQWYWHIHSMYQELLDVPWLMKLPNQESAGERVRGVWRHLDVAPTVLVQAGLPVPPEMLGRPYLSGTSEPSQPAMSYLKVGKDAVIARQFERPFSLHCESIREGDYQLILSEEQLLQRMQPKELYNLAQDPRQRHNLAWEMPAKTLHLSTLLKLQRARYLRDLEAEDIAPDEIERMLRDLNYLR